jgi:hypothetical protein
MHADMETGMCMLLMFIRLMRERQRPGLFACKHALISAYLNVFICEMCVCLHTHTHTHIYMLYIYICVCVYVCIQIYIYVYKYIYIHMYAGIEASRKAQYGELGLLLD